MKQKLFELLQTRFQGVDDKILDRVAAKLAKTTQDTEDDIKTAVDGVTFAQVLESYGDARATEAAQTAVKSYEKKHGLQDGKPVAKPDPQPDPQPQNEPANMPEWAKALVASNEAMQKQLAGFQAKETHATRKAKLEDMIKDAPENVQNMYRSNFAAMSFADDQAFETWQNENTPIIEALVNDIKAKGAIVKPPMAGGNKKPGEVDPLVAARAEKIAEAANKAAPVFRGVGAN